MNHPAVSLPLLLLTALLSACTSSPAPETLAGELVKLQKAGFTTGQIFGGHLTKTQRLRPEQNLAGQVLELIAQAGPARNRGLWQDTHYTLELFIGSSGKSDKMTVEVTKEGHAWMKRGTGRRVEFYSPDLAELLSGQRTYGRVKDSLTDGL